MKKLLKEVAVLAMAAVVAVSSVSGVQAAVASPTVSVVPVDKKNVAATDGNNVDTKADGTAEVNDVTVSKNIATVPATVTVDGVTYTVTVIKAKAFAKTAKKAKKIVIPATVLPHRISPSPLNMLTICSSDRLYLSRTLTTCFISEK